MKNRMAIGCSLLLALGAGCAGSKVHFENAPLDQLDLSRGRQVTGRASSMHLFQLIPIGVNDRQARAYAQLKEAAGSDYLTNIKVYDSWKFAFIGEKYGTIMTAMAYPDKKHSQQVAPVSLTRKLEELQALHAKGVLTDKEYEGAKQKALGN